ncbi:MAG: hypothetical protein GY810_23230, partial [Aureispira sp.]|nr:hypothetical protein [Aureispira sp.]
MDSDKLYQIIRVKIEKLLPPNWIKATLHFLHEEQLSEYEVSYWGKDGVQNSLCGSEYHIERYEEKIIGSFLEERNKTEKCNCLKLTIFPNDKFELETTWDEQKHQLSLALAQSDLDLEVKGEAMGDNSAKELTYSKQKTTNLDLREKIRSL